MSERAPAGAPPRILVVDDDPATRVALEAALAPLGHPVVTASSGDAALRLLLEGTFALVLLDVAMPGLDGFQTARLIRQSQRHRLTPIVFLTGLHSAEAVQRGYSVGAADYVEKPVEPEALRAKVRSLLELFRGLDGAPDRPQAAILVVDDEAANLTAFEATLAPLGEPVVTARSGEEALALLATREFAVVLLDVMLPGMDGIHTAAAIRADRRTHGLPIIMVSAITRATEDVARSYAVGAVDFLFAPVAPAILRAKVSVFVELFKQREGARRHEEQLRRIALAEQERRSAEERVRLLEQNQKLREQLALTDRMACLGTISAGVAHEINNPLAALVSSLELAGEEVTRLAAGPDDEARREGLAAVDELLAASREAAGQVRVITADLKSMSRPDEERCGPVDVHRVLESAIRIGHNALRHHARLVKDFGAVSLVDGNAARLGQVFINLLVNAAQAIPEGAADRHEIRVTTRMDEAGRVVVEVRDTGCGIPAEHLAKIFEPFFTTKATGTGTGLGLAVCRRIVVSMGGEITVASTPMKGTTFRVLLPASTAAAEERPGLAREPTRKATRRGRVLVVDDEPMMRSIVRRILAAEHDVVEAESGRAALACLGEGERFDAILCDLMMPDLTGMDLHAELARTDPALAERMVFMTGGVFTDRARQFLDRCSLPTLAKPFARDELRAVVNERVSRGEPCARPRPTPPAPQTA